jgi:hypothetical protein
MIITLFLFILFPISVGAITFNNQVPLNDSTSFTQIKGKIIDSRTKNVLSFATLSLNGDNISTVTNSEGDFSLKVPNSKIDIRLLISFIGNSSKVGSDAVYNIYLNVKLFFCGLLMSYFVKIVISLLHTFLETTLNTSKYILYTLFFEIFIFLC